MALKAIIFSFTFLTFSSAFAAGNPEICDKMKKSGLFSDQQYKDCVKEEGVSQAAVAEKERAAAKKAAEKLKLEREAAAEAANAAKIAAIDKNIEIKEFTEEELFEKSKKSSFIAFKVDWSKKNKSKDIPLTTGDALCSYLGYETSLGGEYSKETRPEEPLSGGMIVPTVPVVGIVKSVDVHPNRGPTFMTKKFISIKCAKIISDTVEGTLERLEELKKGLVEVGTAPRDTKDQKGKTVNDDGRKIYNRHVFNREVEEKPKAEDTETAEK